MTQKNETPAQSKAATETKTAPEKAPVVTPSEPAIKRSSSGRGSTGDLLSPELVELVGSTKRNFSLVAGSALRIRLK